jgi:hypothetical protein
MFRIFLAICLIAGAFGGQAVAGEFTDTGTQTRIFVNFIGIESNVDLHMCRGGAFMVGVHVGENRFLCDDSIGFMGKTYAPSDLKPNYAPGRQDRYSSHRMAACPPGTAMTGLHVGKNVLLCAPLQTNDLFVDASTERAKMHACPAGSVMVGIHVGRNLLLCGHVQ